MERRELKTTILLFIITFFTITFRENLFIGLFFGNWTLMKEIFLYEWSYSVALILILFAHEMGHYIPARIYGIRASLPFFIPFPIGPIGTMGAVIRIKEAIPDKVKLFDIGVGGPVMSLILSLPCWIIGLYLSELTEINADMNSEMYIFFGDSIFTYWTGQLIHGPYDTQSFDIAIHPLAKAGWVGLIVTAINLIPFGQLDGGHIIYALFGENYRKWIHYLFIFFLILSLWNFTWLIWAFLIYFMIKIEHPFVPDHPEKRLDTKRKILGFSMLLSLLFIFVPSPIILGTEMESSNLLKDIFNYLVRG